MLLPFLSMFPIQAIAGSDNTIHIACVGDSTTFGMNIKERENLSYPAQLQQLLGDNYTVGNFGSNGATAIRTTPKRGPYITRDVYQQSLESEPDMVILTLGANDSKASFWNEQQYQKDLTLLLEEYLALTPIVLLGLPAPAFNQSGEWDVNEGNLVHARLLVRELAAKYHLQVVDFYSPLLDEGLFQADGVHPNRYGAQKMAYAVKNHLGL
ncbi:GDSL-type esterase/lipase family protein [Photobacterium minamisatsumaniensis]|uniref:GDSL-type esterase/lipase family protein n=1 Tax=Photobacterium minamisatsumaniensis TaxID=2910233 RepID=UPI003D0A43C1